MYLVFGPLATTIFFAAGWRRGPYGSAGTAADFLDGVKFL